MEKIQVLLLDADGLVLQQARYFSEVYSQEYGVSTEVLMRFFRGVFRECQQGKADLKQELVSVLKEWQWQGTVDELQKYWFSSCTIPDEAVLKVIQDVRSKGIRCFLASNQERYRGEYLEKDLGFGDRLDGSFFSYEIGHHKSDPEFFRVILERLQVPAETVLFLDNDASNVAVAQSVGIRAKVYTGVSDLLGVI